MPYITEAQRLFLAEVDGRPRQPGELNYLVTMELLDAVKHDTSELLARRVRAKIESYIEMRGASYTTYNDVVGALWCAGVEFNRRIPKHLLCGAHHRASDALDEVISRFYVTTVVPYEKAKIKENGDVYP